MRIAQYYAQKEQMNCTREKQFGSNAKPLAHRKVLCAIGKSARCFLLSAIKQIKNQPLYEKKLKNTSETNDLSTKSRGKSCLVCSRGGASRTHKSFKTSMFSITNVPTRVCFWRQPGAGRHGKYYAQRQQEAAFVGSHNRTAS